MNSVNWTGKLVGCAIFEPLVERLGYKKTIYILACIQIVAVTTYLAVGIVEPTIPTYQAELAPAAIRGFFAGNVQVLVHLGSIWGAGMSRAYAYEQGRKGWMIPVSMQMIPAILLLICTPFCIESPRWLVAHNRKAEALNNMNRIRPRSFQESGRTALEVDAFEQAIQENMTMNRGSWLDLFSKTYLSRTIVSVSQQMTTTATFETLTNAQIVTLMFFFQQTTGQQFANSYGPT
ncbi:hypothetical protein LTR23_008056 [Exophiala sp. CCFEE 6169]|uniref:Major facilitator superfamily (MFS) profile domain-containing protein n=1 Tax=Vermiconidia calcicola TaxID=1690605 RepID=A0AAV9Q6D1_9PEZI|nr:hypothetical protein LTR18_006839 [Exophiala xenobiotica]KAK5535014.1 hypothetical protein LTR25_006021 [Vermiconidia calcicola]KAK5536194.1 hypothetical protein LTR23_008056 [Chaetothyriales sp. CCFEE 6169]